MRPTLTLAEIKRYYGYSQFRYVRSYWQIPLKPMALQLYPHRAM